MEFSLDDSNALADRFCQLSLYSSMGDHISANSTKPQNTRRRCKGTFKIFLKRCSDAFTTLELRRIGVGAAQVNNALDAVFARYADSEGPAYLWYAIRLQQLPLALLASPFQEPSSLLLLEQSKWKCFTI